MRLKTQLIYEKRRLLPKGTKYVVALMLLLCVIGSAVAANNTFTLYTTKDMADAQETWTNSGVGTLVALIVLVSTYTPYIILVLLALLAIVAKMSKSSEMHKSALQAMFWVIFIMLGLVIAIDLITGMCPDISTIEIGG